MIADPVANLILSGKVGDDDKVIVDVGDGGLSISNG
jgi:hypothetical protein